jgi:hypothetical protein
MRSPIELRARAARFLALVQIARQSGDIRLASVLADKAARLMELADAAEAGQMIPPPPLEATRPNVQQQQQIQPKNDNERG